MTVEDEFLGKTFDSTKKMPNKTAQQISEAKRQSPYK
jgi:hypothetical protein